MSKEYLEALERLYKCNDDDYTLGYQQHDYKLLQQALNRLEQIDNANPSEALTYIDAFIEENSNDIKNQINTGYDVDTQAKWVNYLEHKSFMLSTIKQALLKQQQSKHYLKWEDLEFDAPTSIRVKMGDTQYSLSRRNRSGVNSVVLRDDDLTAYLLLYEKDKQFFNDLHLERVEE